jgi:hypothetical protein
VDSYHLNKEEHKREENTIHNILLNNSFPLPRHKRHTPKQHPPHQPPENKHKWTVFTYTGKETMYITNLFKRSDLRITFRTNNTLHNLLTHKTHHQDKFTRSGVYRLTWPDCGKAYVGQTGRDFTSRYHEHKRSFRNNTHTSKFANHFRSFSPIQDVMQILQFHKKGPHLNTIERFHIHKVATSYNHLNDEHTIAPTESLTPC